MRRMRILTPRRILAGMVLASGVWLIVWSMAWGVRSPTDPTPLRNARPIPGKGNNDVTVTQQIVEAEGPDLLRARIRWFFEGRKGPKGKIPWNARNRALAQLRKNLAQGILSATPQDIPGTLWQSIGPMPLLERGLAVPYTGRVTALAVHPANTQIVYLGGAQGGVWKTTNGGGVWTPLTDQQPSLAIGAIALDPTNPNVIYVGTGEPHLSCDSYFGAGILKSTDGGNSWTVLGASVFQNTSISRIVVDPNNPNIVYAGNTIGAGGFVCYARSGTFGVWKSLDGGVNWMLILGPTQTGGTTLVHDLILTSAGELYAAVLGNGIWKSTDAGATWTKLGGGLPTTNVGRIDIAVHERNPSTIYAVYENASNGRQLGTFKSTDGGNTWTSLPIPTGNCMYWPLDDICTLAGNTSGQCWYDLAIEVNPNDGGVWLGGIGLFVSLDGGMTWNSVCPIDMHVDQHVIAFGFDGSVWVGNDGGVFVTTNNGTDWTNLNNTLALTQFYPGASLHPTDRNFAIGGSQDNGTVHFTGPPSWQQIMGGDGAFSAIDPRSPNDTWYVSYQFLTILKTTNAGGFWTPADTGINKANVAFIAPYVMCPDNPDVLIAGTDNVWRTTSGGSSWSSNSPDPLFSGANIRALAFARGQVCDVYFVGLSNGRVFRTVNAGGSWTDITGTIPARGVNDIAVHPTDPNTVYVALSGFGGNHLFKSTDALSPNPTWAAVDTGIPDTPINAVLLDPTNPNVVYIGTDIGIFRSSNGGSSWQVFMNGHPNVAVFDLVASAGSNTIISFTHGRGAFRLAQGTPDFSMTCDPVRLAALPGGAASSTCTVHSSNGFSNAVTLSCANLPAGITCTFTPNPVTPPANGSASSTLTVNVAGTVTPGTYTFQVTATDGTRTRLDQLSILVSSTPLIPATLMVDGAGNGVLEVGETAVVAPGWHNLSATAMAVTGSASNLTGPGGPTYTLTDATADYGTIGGGTTVDCANATGNCYAVQITATTRPATHWDATLDETLSSGEMATWSLHVGESFSDIPRTFVFYRHIETMLHRGVTSGCTATTYCPLATVIRGQMAVFITQAERGGSPPAAYTDPATGRSYDCTDGMGNHFTDVPDSVFYCRHVHYLWARGFVSGCQATRYCPFGTVNRGQMAIFIALGILGGPPPTSYTDPTTGRSYHCNDGAVNHFTDVPDSALYCAHVHYLWARGIISGCAADRYCVSAPVNRAQMAAFIVNGFRLLLYGP